MLLKLERQWLSPVGLPERPWFANLYGASDPYSGYAAWVFPALRLAIEEKQPMNAAAAAAQLVEVYQALETNVKTMNASIAD
jgi:N-acetylated-alpha-linked acidic dipeptidase